MNLIIRSLLNTVFIFLLVFTGVMINGSLVFAQSPVPEGAEVQRVKTGYQFVEGPLWLEPGYLIFSDIPANTIYRLSPDGSVDIYLTPSGNSNGLAMDLEGRVLLAQHGKRSVSRLETDGTETALATHYEGKRLNSPNDLAVKTDGSIYFTDPPYGISSSQEELGYSGIFRIAADGQLYLLDNSLSRPNGIVFSPDEKKLYVNDSQARLIYVWDVKNDSILVNKKLFATMTGSGSADGMKVDTNGNLYSTGPGGIWIFKPDGSVIDKIPVPETTTNLNWGEADRKTLYISAGKSIYSIRLNATGVTTTISPDNSSVIPSRIQLFKNYPNPFNPNTTIFFKLTEPDYVILQVFDVQGKLVKTINNNYIPAGEHRFIWNARNNTGIRVTSGIYFYRLKTDKTVMSGKMLFIG
ncbi:SMP-30/gluconolactonase/LRE family protein [candidate division KSB1 bacterium]|nr:SMP-30/gluconolactonase/LRE family protein [candidate division KSB1 bacterium]